MGHSRMTNRCVLEPTKRNSCRGIHLLTAPRRSRGRKTASLHNYLVLSIETETAILVAKTTESDLGN